MTTPSKVKAGIIGCGAISNAYSRSMAMSLNCSPTPRWTS